uniref:NADH dehydrogenase subunit 4 n=1 Tax=Simocephalus serrulatus TaxID=117539 RepID=UPI001EE0F8FD|nr:NADH dehydrogenase subunit 4 [Simocephalus serrulatus]UKB87190.1 NADH dehydrogenase subunit 4 [Simocephalus serrulatus]
MLKYVLFSLLSLTLFSEWNLMLVLTMVTTFIWMNSMSNFNLGLIDFFQVDTLSFLMISLSMWVVILMLIMSFYIKNLNNFSSSFFCLSLFMLAFLILSFSTSNALLFYIMFEATLVPIFLLIMGWGYQPERVTASYFLLFYTLSASLPLLLSILFVENIFFSLDFIIFNIFEESSFFLFWGLILAFLVKLPVYLGHLWLPKAHVEAPVAGSMILAGVLLKLGGYGLIRIVPLIQESLKLFSPILVSIGLMGGVMASFICIRQTDCKSLVAYSSVAHMALVIVGLSMNSFLGWAGAIIIMVAHGLCSSGLFALVGMVYERMGTRNLVLLRSMIVSAPLLTMWWFLFSVSNMAAPPTPSLAGEIYIFISTLSWMGFSCLLVGALSFLAGVYNLYLFISTQHGNKLSSMSLMQDASMREHWVLLFHLVPFLLIMPLLINSYS